MASDYKRAKMGRLLDKVGDTQNPGGENRRIIVYNLPYPVEIYEVQEFFGADTIEGITLYEKMAFVQFKRPCDHTQALIKNLDKLKGRPIEIKPYHRAPPVKKKKPPSPPPQRVMSPPRPRDYYKNRTRGRSRERSRSRERASESKYKPESVHREHSDSRYQSRESDHSRSLTRDRSADLGRDRSSSSTKHSSNLKRHDSSSTRPDTGSTRRSSHDNHHSSSLVPKSPTRSGPQFKSSSSDQLWGAKPFSESSSFPVTYPASNLQKIFADKPSVAPDSTPQQPLQQPEQQALEQPQLSILPPVTTPYPQLQSKPETLALTLAPNDPLALPPRIKVLLQLVMLDDTASGISLDQAKELEQYVVKVRKEMEEARATACIEKPDPIQNGDSATNGTVVPTTNGSQDVTDQAKAIADKIRKYNA